MFSSLSTPSTGRDFLTFGNEALAVHRADERRTVESHRNHLAHTLRDMGQTSPARRWLGTLMIGLGTLIAGNPARTPQRDGTTPDTTLAPTR